MSNEVYANGMEVSCKAAAGKSIAAFPDVCFTPPQTPATPPGVPIPYPNTGMASDTSGGSKTVQISGQEVMMKDSSYFKTSSGDEAGNAPKKNVITSQIQGKCYYTAWSMDVKIEGENAVRHLDMMTHNHASAPGATPPWPYQDGQTQDGNACQKDQQKMKEECEDMGLKDPHCPPPLNIKTETFKNQVAPQARSLGVSRSAIQAPAATAAAEKDACVKAQRCHLKPYKENKKKNRKECCPGQTPHHVPPKSCFLRSKYHPGGKSGPTGKYYDKDEALCVCLEGTSQHFGSHGKNHAAIDHLCETNVPPINNGDPVTIAEYNKICAKAVAAQCGCDPACIEAQLNYSTEPKERKIQHVDSYSSAAMDDEYTPDLSSDLASAGGSG
jgi:hypothetical protein